MSSSSRAGTGGAKLVRGMVDVAGPERVAAIVNTGDDIEIYGAYVSPDPDLVSFWLADLIDERGWGLRGDTFAVMDALRGLGVEVWFNLGDRDLAWCLQRRGCSPRGSPPTAALARLNEAIGVRARVLPMSDDSGAHVGSHRRRLARLPGVHDPRARTGARSRGWSSAAPSGRAPSARGARGDRERARDRHRALQPAGVDRPDPRRARDPRGARRRRRPGGGRQPDRGRRGAEGADGVVHGLRRARVQRRRRGRLLRRAARRDRGRRERRAARDAADGHAHGRRRAPSAAWPSRRSASPKRSVPNGARASTIVVGRCAPPRSCPSSASRRPSASRRERRRPLRARACARDGRPTCCWRWRRPHRSSARSSSPARLRLPRARASRAR